jgi:large subunit ribosomal protein L22
MEIRASLRYLHMSPRKVRRVAQLIRGLPVDRAEAELLVRPERSAIPIRKLLSSAVANARNTVGAPPEAMRIRSLTVQEGPRLKRFRPRSRGMAHPILRRMSHVTIVLDVPTPLKGSRRNVPQTSPHVTETPRNETVSTSEKSSPPKAPQREERRLRKPNLPKFRQRIFQRKSV